MTEEINILDDIEHQLRRHVVFDADEKYVAISLWIVGTYLVKTTHIPVFEAFPMLAFMSPEPDSGKSRALKVTELLSCNSIAAGKYTTAALLAKIDQELGETTITLCLDEIDTIFSHGKDNADLIMLLNLGYERGAVIARLHRFGDGIIETPAYCPKAFAGLKIARIPGPTKTRTIIVGMRPKSEAALVERHIDRDALARLKQSLEKWSLTESILEKLKTISLSEATFLNNRNEQIWQPLLAIAKVTSEEWYGRALKAARFFIAAQPTEKSLSHAILLATYRVFRSGNSLDRIHTATLLEELWQSGIPSWVDAGHLSNYLSGYDPAIKPRQMKIGGLNRNGYDWHTFLDSFKTYISEKEVTEVERELGIGPIVEVVDKVDSRKLSQGGAGARASW